MDEEVVFAEYIELISERKEEIIRDLAKLGWDSYSADPLYDMLTKEEHTKGLRFILGDWPGAHTSDGDSPESPALRSKPDRCLSRKRGWPCRMGLVRTAH